MRGNTDIEDYCLPPQSVAWVFYESTARGMLPRAAKLTARNPLTSVMLMKQVKEDGRE